MANSSQKLIKIPNLPEYKMIALHNFLFSEKYFHKTCLTFNSSLTAGPRKMKVLRSFKMSGTTHPTTKHHIPKALILLHVTLG
jgi:ubiquitin C-terminal hydrolase